ncbi:hypothetical protein LJB96_05205 [Methanobrevibacter sp. OttesenSCG-928-K11]|nr:hypothetical protein [Methanobrevibacter sp. OttesenSCG-928-K11]MDL2270211.1 hypothetical protein [Methanobrevibacter sp. OttesenSCG-928-I08]
MEHTISEIVEEFSTKIGMKFIIVEGYAKAYDFYIKINFELLNNTEEEIKKLNKAKERNPSQTFILFQNITKL